MLTFQEESGSLEESGIPYSCAQKCALSHLLPSQVLTVLNMVLASCACFRLAKCMDFIYICLDKEWMTEDTFQGSSFL